MQNFWQKVAILHFGFWSQEAKKSPNEPQEALMRAINSAFFMELNITLKILAFCIPSFQSSWHFAFYGELNTPLVTRREEDDWERP